MQTRPSRGDPIELRRQRPVTAADEGHVLEECAFLDPRHELLFAQEPVLTATLLSRALRPRRRGHGDLELRLTFERAV